MLHNRKAGVESATPERVHLKEPTSSISSSSPFGVGFFCAENLLLLNRPNYMALLKDIKSL